MEAATAIDPEPSPPKQYQHETQSTSNTQSNAKNDPDHAQFSAGGSLPHDMNQETIHFHLNRVLENRQSLEERYLNASSVNNQHF